MVLCKLMTQRHHLDMYVQLIYTQAFLFASEERYRSSRRNSEQYHIVLGYTVLETVSVE